MQFEIVNEDKIKNTQETGMKYFCVVSHTHWDREWYMPFEQFRIRLVDLMDRLFAIIEKNPGYIFHLDAQTVVLEDYLEIRPWRRSILEKNISTGNIVVGPWYLQNDFYLTSGEATVRNLLIGTAMAEKFGRCGKTGYAPDQFGNISQLPQILSQFGIDNFIFGRGYGSYEKDKDGLTLRENAPTEFIWEGSDGTKLLAIHMKFWYNNAQRLNSDMNKAMPLLDTIEKLFEGVAITPYLLLMNGVDHLEAQDDLLSVIDGINKRFESNKKTNMALEQNVDYNIKQYEMEDYVNIVKNYIDENHISMRTQKGELRDGHDWELLKGTLSSRIYLKQQNVKAQNVMEMRLEPMSALYELAGADNSYDKDYMNHLWKQLLKNHPHDSICGCSRDEVHDHMEDNYKKIEETTSYLLNKKSQDIANHLEVNTKNPDDNLITLMNTIASPRSEVVEMELFFLESENVNAFSIKDKCGEKCDFCVTNIESRKLDVFSALNLPGVLDVKVFTILIATQMIEGFAFKGLLVKKSEKFDDNLLVYDINIKNTENISFGKNGNGLSGNELTNSTLNTNSPGNINTIENEQIRVTINAKGEIDVIYLETNIVLLSAIQIEELPDRGDAYVFFKTDDIPCYGTDFKATITCCEKNSFQQKISISYAMNLPKEYDFKNRKRCDEKIACPVELTLMLKKGSDILEIETFFVNTAKDHRVRLLVDTGILSKESVADIPFDIITHDVQPSYPDTMSDVHPNTSFAGIVSHTHGIAVFTTGAHEYEHLSDKKSVLAFTLLRSTGVISMAADLTPGGGCQWDVSGNQCLRELKNRFGLVSFEGNVANIATRALLFRTPVQTAFSSCDDKKFAGGRFAIQESSLSELYYLPDLHPKLKIKDNQSIVKVYGEGIIVTALKKAETHDNFVLRLVNLNEISTSIKIIFDGNISKTNLAEKLNESLGEKNVTMQLRAKEIVTLFLEKSLFTI